MTREYMIELMNTCFEMSEILNSVEGVMDEKTACKLGNKFHKLGYFISLELLKEEETKTETETNSKYPDMDDMLWIG